MRKFEAIPLEAVHGNVSVIGLTLEVAKLADGLEDRVLADKLLEIANAYADSLLAETTPKADTVALDAGVLGFLIDNGPVTIGRIAGHMNVTNEEARASMKRVAKTAKIETSGLRRAMRYTVEAQVEVG